MEKYLILKDKREGEERRWCDEGSEKSRNKKGKDRKIEKRKRMIGKNGSDERKGEDEGWRKIYRKVSDGKGV